jgi:uridine kinase
LCLISFCHVNASDVTILEGILVFHDQKVRNLMDLEFFVDTSFSCATGFFFLLYCRIYFKFVELIPDMLSVGSEKHEKVNKYFKGLQVYYVAI